MSLTVANVELTDTFNTWRVRTNTIAGEAVSGTSPHPQTVAANTTFTGTVTASAFIGDGSQLTNAGSSVATDTANHNLFVPFTGITSGTMTSANVNSNFYFNPSTGTVTATAFVGDGSGLTSAGSTVATDTTDHDLKLVFTGVTSGTMTTANVATALTFNPSSGTLTSTVVKTSALKDSSNRTLVIKDASDAIVWGG